MKLIPARTGRRAIASVLSLVVVVFTLSLLPARGAAQEPTAPAGAAPGNAPPNCDAKPKLDYSSYQTFYLTDISSQHDANDIQTDLRNMLPHTRIYYVQSQHALSMQGSAADIQSAQKILSDIDHLRKSYRLTFSLTEMDGDKTAGVQRVALIVLDSGEKTEFKQGSKVPIVTGTTAEGSSTQSSQVQYLDLGLTIDAAVDGSPEVLRLSTKIAQTSVLSERAAGSGGDPSISQTVLEGATTLVPGKPLVLGSLDLPGSTRREEISVVAEPIH